MKKSNESLSEIKLVGITARTSNSLEANPETAKISLTIGNYFENNLSQKIANNAWKEIWRMQEADLGGKRTYVADFEIYDERAKDYSNITLDIYIGVTQ
jgi:predicted transcriptional regulator YdeE